MKIKVNASALQITYTRVFRIDTFIASYKGLMMEPAQLRQMGTTSNNVALFFHFASSPIRTLDGCGREKLSMQPNSLCLSRPAPSPGTLYKIGILAVAVGALCLEYFVHSSYYVNRNTGIENYRYVSRAWQNCLLNVLCTK